MASMEVQEFHQQGNLSIENRDEVVAMLQNAAEREDRTVDVGLQVAPDGRIWLCVEGTAFIRFKPGMSQRWMRP